MFCPECGSEVKPGRKFCDNCGISLAGRQVTPSVPKEPNPKQQPTPQPAPTPQPQATTQPPSKPPSQPKKKKVWPLLVGIGAAVLVVAVVLVAVFVIIPGGTQKGVWVQTKTTSTGRRNDYTWNTNQEYMLDKAGNASSVEYTYSDSRGTESNISESYTFHESGQCLTGKNTTDDKTHNYSYDWDSLGSDKPSSINVLNTDTNKTESLNKYEYNEQGFIKHVTADLTFEDGSTATRQYDFDADGLSTHIEDSSKDGTLITDIEYKRDSNNRPISSHSKTVNKESQKTEQENDSTYEYDKNGNMIHEMSNLTVYKDGKKIDTITTEYDYEYTYVDNPSPWRRKMQHLYFGTAMCY